MAVKKKDYVPEERHTAKAAPDFTDRGDGMTDDERVAVNERAKAKVDPVEPRVPSGREEALPEPVYDHDHRYGPTKTIHDLYKSG